MLDMKPFVFDAALTDPLDVARCDNMEYFIDKILEHKSNLKKKTEIKFLVSWLGYAQEHNSWEPYLTEHKLRFLIPQKFLK